MKVKFAKKAGSLLLSLSMIATMAYKMPLEAISVDSEDDTIVEKALLTSNQIQELYATETAKGVKLEWNAVEGAKVYDVYRAVSAYAEYEKIATVDGTNYVDENTNDDKYSNYYKIAVINQNDESTLYDLYTSIETELFGRNTYIFAQTDDPAAIDKVLADLFTTQNDYDADAQFKADHYQVYFKPGDYTETSCINLGYYTAINGLGETPYDVKLNNIAIPAYLPEGALGAPANNATCNFWRSTENVSIINTGNEQGKAGNGSWRPDFFNWAVAQAAPLRRVYSERPVAYDWNYGWASGGYVADCKFDGTFVDNGQNLTAGTFSGQQFYTRNTEMAGNAYGTTLNNFFQGVEAPNLPNFETGKSLISGQGYSNWGIAGSDGGQQVFTNIEKTKKLSEKPFLYLDDNGEYQIFVPSLKENTSGTSWSEDYMGDGHSISLSDFYVAKPTDSAEKINNELAKGKNLYLTPGVYHAEEPIVVNNPNTIVLGTGLATIIPDNGEMAMKIADVDGVKLAGIVFDAGEYSNYLLVVGDKGKHNDHSNNPTVLQDIFFRVGGTTDTLTKADNAIEINSDDVLTDHFWIWRADHGAGVEWYGNNSYHGLIVNGDDVTCYALFNEHFQKYDTLWNGENGATYFYQNEKCYDPISQEAWMSHNDSVNGYAAYKVANNVKNHYAVGLGMYNVFIYTGPTYDSSEVQIQLDNAIEVPNSENVIIENACIQTFANDDDVLQKFNHIINGVGNGVSSGTDPVTGETGEGWSRQFLLSYQNGTAVVGKKNTLDEKGKYIGVDVIENIKALGDDDIDFESLQAIYDKYVNLDTSNYTEESVEMFNNALNTAKELLEVDRAYVYSIEVETAINSLKNAVDNLESEEIVNKTALQIAVDVANNVTEEQLNNVVPAVKDAFTTALANAKIVLENATATQEEVEAAFDRLATAIQMLDFIKGDKAALRSFITKVENTVEEEYTPATWTAFAAALETGNTVLANENAMQEEVDNAYTNLVKAYLNLRLVPNKDKLEDLINQTKALVAANYTADTWENVSNALVLAENVMSNENATSEEVTNAETVLTKAVEGLVVSNTPVTPSTPAVDNTVDSAVKTPVSSGDTTASVKTGDESLTGLFGAVTLLSLAGATLLKRKEN